MGGRLRWEQDVAGCIAGRPHLLPIFGDVHGVVERLREHNPDLFVCLNVIRNLERAQGLPYQEWTPVPPGVLSIYNAWYEVHNLREVPTLVFAVRHGSLDMRTVDDIRRTDLKERGANVLEEIRAHNAAREASQKREQANRIESFALDNRHAFQRAAWGPSIFGPKTAASH